MAISIKKRGKMYRNFRVDLWGYYRTYFNRETGSEWKKVDHTLYYWKRVYDVIRELKRLKKARYVYKIWNRKRYERLKRYKADYILPRYLRNFYIVLKKKSF